MIFAIFWIISGVALASSASKTGCGVVDDVARAKGEKEASSPGARVALCFYGLNRSLRHTLSSIRENVLGVLDGGCVRTDIFLHTFSNLEEEDTRAAPGANSGSAASEMVHAFNYTRYAVTDRDVWERSHAELRARLARLDQRYDGKNMRNLLRQMGSLRFVTELWSAEASVHGGDDYYTVVLYLRPDLNLLDKLDLPQLIALGPGTLLTPYWHQWHGLNDRVAAARPAVARAFGERLELVRPYAESSPPRFIRAESFLKWVMVEHHGYDTTPLAMRGQRIRANGRAADNDFCLRWCSPDAPSKCRGDCRGLVPEGIQAPPLPLWARKNRWGLPRFGNRRTDKIMPQD